MKTNFGNFNSLFRKKLIHKEELLKEVVIDHSRAMTKHFFSYHLEQGKHRSVFQAAHTSEFALIILKI